MAAATVSAISSRAEKLCREMCRENQMPRAPASHYAFCLQKAKEARRNYKMADNFHDHDSWAYQESKWIDLANWYRSDEDLSVITHPACPHCRGVMMLSFIEPADPGFDRRVFKCVACEYIEDVKVRIGEHFRAVSSGRSRGRSTR
jgi:hypothetical protein